jgi:hypothetical protein
VTEPARWYHLQGERQLGPLELDTMRRLVLAGTVGPDTYVWSDGMAEWLRARDVPALVPPGSVQADLPDWTPSEPQSGSDEPSDDAVREPSTDEP